MKRITGILAAALLLAGMFAGCAKKDAAESESVPKEETAAENTEQTEEQTETEEAYNIDYLVLVNKENKLPDTWEDEVEIVHMTNSLGDDVEVETEAYDAYLELKADLEADDVHVDLDSAYRSVAAQQEIVERFTEKYGEDYVKQYVAVPGFSEHHTGLALDLYLNIDGVDIYENEDMVEYPEVWSKIHAKLADHGFILRYIEGWEDITGYSYEPWHIRYVGTDAAKEITDRGITLEEYLGKVPDTAVPVDLGTSELFTEKDRRDAVKAIKTQFNTWEGCELHSVKYAGDEWMNEEKVQWMNELGKGKEYTECIAFTSDFHSPKENAGAFNEDYEYTDYEWWLARTEGGEWELLTWGYGGLAQ